MKDRFNLLSQQLLQKDFSDCNIEELELLSQQYPYFAPAQFLLLRKLKEENRAEYAQQYQKAALYHHDPLAFDFLINDQDYDTSLLSEQIETPEAEISLPNPAVKDQLADQPEISDVVVAGTHEEEPMSSTETGSFDIKEVKEAELPGPINNKEGIQPKSLLISQKADLPLSFEPFHTVDYFASVGIKLSQDEAGKDKFGRQLKSFTEWLKTMKKLPATEQIKKLDPHAEEKVENIAAHSLDNAEVLTETMAEVWVKQGKLEKAIEVYNKLSLQNPSKRAYFAAKLENLKKAI